MRSLAEINKVYEEIIHGAAEEQFRSGGLADLMDEMEKYYQNTHRKEFSLGKPA